ncbi:phosphoserine phosphatase SerB [Brachybacterium sp. EF45031]|uniref:phosphoserine phosphatase SerB n=1 Tax=Brachybacterium sillae TaxID=2810536 RepID=UPI00217DE06F|nr:phosphoserine phosphatase SerB [Brachybacterium sillae]MCS6710650.1 phosphoserine phosphatase SerB [Brachybacterium sillae]
MSDPRALLVSDVDSTFIRQEVIELVADHAGTRERVEEITDRAMRGELDFAHSLRERVRTLAGVPVAALQEVTAQLEPTPGALELVERCRAAGVRTALVSGGFHEVVDPLAQRAGVDHVVANRFGVQDGLLTGELDGPIVDAEGKAAALRELAARYGLPLARTVAVGDGANDVLMIRAAGRGVGFRPKPALRAEADAVIDGDSLVEVWPQIEAVLGAESV